MSNVNWEQKASDAIDAVAIKWGTTSEAYVRGFIVDNCIGVAFGIISILAICFVIKWIHKPEHLREFGNELLLVKAVGGFLIFFFLTLVLSNISKIINHDYYILKDIMEMLK